LYLCNMKQGIVLLILLCIIARSAFSQPVEKGVSRQLAEYRAATVSNVRYDLAFGIVYEDSIRGEETVTFDYKGDRDLPIDFLGQVRGVDNQWCIINGKVCSPAYSNEHILLPKELLRQGHNEVYLGFVSTDKALNRHSDYMYTLFVPGNARSAFPCFDQPDLKAQFKLTLSYPDNWRTMSYADADTTGVECDMRFSAYPWSKPMPTYLFSFVAGKFQEKSVVRDGRMMTALYRETDPKKVAQLDKCFDEAALSLRWLEKYTGIPFPFQKYGFVVLPGYQFGGMEHPGAIQFTDREIFLGSNPTPDEEMVRLNLIAHETSHMWFGDLVTMRWFNDVWTKEVFANFMASKISREQFPNINHDLNFLKNYYPYALSTDRTDGTHPIQQPLDNLMNAGLLYGNIIYEKAPIMMSKLEEQMGAERFRKGLQLYLRKFSYGNATWDDLIDILDKEAPEAHLKDFSHDWVKEKGLPTITWNYQHHRLTIHQTDPYNRGLAWPQNISFGIAQGDSIHRLAITLGKPEITIPIKGSVKYIIPNLDGRGYGQFIFTDGKELSSNIHFLEKALLGESPKSSINKEVSAYSVILSLYENYLKGKISHEQMARVLSETLPLCKNPLIASTLCSQLASVHFYAPEATREKCEQTMFELSNNHPLPSVRKQLMRSLSLNATSPALVDTLYQIWQSKRDTLLNDQDYTRMSYHLAIMKPDQWQKILQSQRARLKTEDDRREFEFISRACTPDTLEQQRLFESLIPKSGRTVEPWARTMLSLLCDETREPFCLRYIHPGLDALLPIQQSSDIFFPGYWCSALLGNHHNPEFFSLVDSWIKNHPDYPQSLKNKIKQNIPNRFSALQLMLPNAQGSVQCPRKNTVCTDTVSSYSHILIVFYDSAIGKKDLLKTVKKLKGNILYDYKNFNGIAASFPQDANINTVMATLRKVKGVLSVEQDKVLQLENFI